MSKPKSSLTLIRPIRWSRAAWSMVERAASEAGAPPTTWIRRVVLAKLGVSVAAQEADDALRRIDHAKASARTRMGS
jgi:hypothetical protein